MVIPGVTYNSSGDKLDADDIVVSVGPWSRTAESLSDDLKHFLVLHVEVNLRPDGIMYTCGISFAYLMVLIAVLRYLLIHEDLGSVCRRYCCVRDKRLRHFISFLCLEGSITIS